MSQVSNTHNIVKLSKDSKPFPEQRLARIIAKKNKEGMYESEHLTESKCVSVPKVTEVTEDELNSLMPHIAGMLMNAQDALIRERVMVDGATSIHEDEISVSRCINYLDEESKGNRVTGEYVSKWFAEVYAEPAAEFITRLCSFNLETLTDAQVEVVSKKVNVLTAMFAGFASGKYSPDIPKCKAMIKFGEFLGEENQDARMMNYVQKAHSIKQVKEQEMSMDALGF